jgi:hypothetical protein
MERVERIEDLDVLGFCTQGTVDAGGFILTCTVWSPAAVSRPTGNTGSEHAMISFYLSKC